MFKPILAVTAFVALVAVQPAGAQMPGPTSPGGVSLAIRDGLVTLKAEQASIRQILAEWERQGQMKVVGAERITAAPVTLTFKDVPEKQALDIVMRGIPGYVAVDRTAAAASPSASRFDRLVVMARAATPVPATAAAARPSPAAAQPMLQEQQPLAYAPPGFNGMVPQAGDDDAPQQPDRADVDQFANQEPPMPEAPVVSPYPNAYPGSPYVGGGGAAAASGPYGGNPTAAAAAGLTSAPPETQFDYANPQKYFEERRLQQQGAQPQPSAFPSAGTGVGQGSTGRPAPLTGSPTAPTTLSRPGIAPVPQAQPNPAQGEFFNPYNLPADWVPPPPVPETGPPVEPDRAKYNNPYEQPKPPQE
jgi:hypothetical protein